MRAREGLSLRAPSTRPGSGASRLIASPPAANVASRCGPRNTLSLPSAYSWIRTSALTKCGSEYLEKKEARDTGAFKRAREVSCAVDQLRLTWARSLSTLLTAGCA